MNKTTLKRQHLEGNTKKTTQNKLGRVGWSASHDFNDSTISVTVVNIYIVAVSEFALNDEKRCDGVTHNFDVYLDLYFIPRVL